MVFAVLGGIVGLGLGFVGGRISALKPVEFPQTDGATEITSVLMMQQDAWNAGDIEGFMEGYVQSDQLRFASGGDVTFGWDETLNRYQVRYSDRAKMGTLKFEIFDVKTIDETNGLIFGQWTLIREADKPSGLFTLHMKKGDAGWKVVSDHTSSASN